MAPRQKRLAGMKPFCEMARTEQLRDLIRRLRRTRADIREYLRDLAYWNQVQARREEPGLGDDPRMAALAAYVDQSLDTFQSSESVRKENP